MRTPRTVSAQSARDSRVAEVDTFLNSGSTLSQGFDLLENTPYFCKHVYSSESNAVKVDQDWYLLHTVMVAGSRINYY
jgi:hypothetical protein